MKAATALNRAKARGAASSAVRDEAGPLKCDPTRARHGDPGRTGAETGWHRRL